MLYFSAEANVSSLTQAMDDLREVRARCEASVVEEQGRSAAALERLRREHQSVLEKVS